MPKRKCCLTHSCTEPRHVLQYNHTHEDVIDEYFPINSGFDSMTMDGWWGNYVSGNFVCIDSRLYASSEDQERQKKRLQSLKMDTYRLQFPDGDSPANSVTIIEKCNTAGVKRLSSEKEVIAFFRAVIGDPVGEDDLEIVTPYRYANITWENRPRYARYSQFQQWVRVPPQLCSVCHKLMFFDIDSWLWNWHNGKSVMFEFKLERELEKFYNRIYQFDQCMAMTDKAVGNIPRMLVIFNENGRVTTHDIKNAVLWDRSRSYESIEQWAEAMKQLLS